MIRHVVIRDTDHKSSFFDTRDLPFKNPREFSNVAKRLLAILGRSGAAPEVTEEEGVVVYNINASLAAGAKSLLAQRVLEILSSAAWMGQATAANVKCEGSKIFLATVEWLAAFFDLRLNDVKPMRRLVLKKNQLLKDPSITQKLSPATREVIYSTHDTTAAAVSATAAKSAAKWRRRSSDKAKEAAAAKAADDALKQGEQRLEKLEKHLSYTTDVAQKAKQKLRQHEVALGQLDKKVEERSEEAVGRFKENRMAIRLVDERMDELAQQQLLSPAGSSPGAGSSCSSPPTAPPTAPSAEATKGKRTPLAGGKENAATGAQ